MIADRLRSFEKIKVQFEVEEKLKIRGMKTSHGNGVRDNINKQFFMVYLLQQ